MKTLKSKICFIFVFFFVMAQLYLPMTVKAQENYHYTYRVVIYSGNQGEFQSTDGISIEKAFDATNEVHIEQIDQTQIAISGLDYGDRVNVRVSSGMVKPVNQEKYYIRGIRESGKDNNTVGTSSFRVEKDIEYVVAYGIKGNMVPYTVNYLDEDGNALLPSEQFYGVVGDKPVIAYQYVDGYQPQAYNLTKILRVNEVENVFNFVYRPIDIQQNADNQNNAVNNNNNNRSDNNANNNGNAGDNAANVNNANGGNDNDNGENIQNQEPQELIDLEDEQVPLSDGDNKNKETGSDKTNAKKIPAIPIVIGVLVLGTIAVLVFLKKRKGKK